MPGEVWGFRGTLSGLAFRAETLGPPSLETTRLHRLKEPAGNQFYYGLTSGQSPPWLVYVAVLGVPRFRGSPKRPVLLDVETARNYSGVDTPLPTGREAGIFSERRGMSTCSVVSASESFLFSGFRSAMTASSRQCKGMFGEVHSQFPSTIALPGNATYPSLFVPPRELWHGSGMAVTWSDSRRGSSPWAQSALPMRQTCPQEGCPPQQLSPKPNSGQIYSVASEPIWLWVNTKRIPFWGRCTTHFTLF